MLYEHESVHGSLFSLHHIKLFAMLFRYMLLVQYIIESFTFVKTQLKTNRSFYSTAQLP